VIREQVVRMTYSLFSAQLLSFFPLSTKR